ncbi:GDSL-type esterase/lipase family protein [Defluviimonas sp. WL0024]|uniref:GDSL-type esterase/lipase family protein n=2 Tax=Albidovulum TaxID=205889 RepID=A0ABT3J735_9RHOB|nr:GDSL-type esterase/lipase family protein [Defluviimonas sp. WL0024]MCU9849638.1 GDSL-type esterase/lipase family protein [Defluviimonas sp. WL0024]MCW3783234.1 GDSL-type esterase/lipase family protein [Defluviimonas salinarum]
MAEIMAFGDSLTWGSRPDGLGRHAAEDRWPNVLAAGLEGVRVAAEGLRGRSTAYDRQSASCDMNGARILPVLLHSHAPLDAVVVMLGSNDIWEDHPVWRVRDGLMRVVEVIQHHAYRLPAPHRPDVLLVAPPAMVACADPDVTPSKIAASEAYAEVVQRVAEAHALPWFDAGTVARASVLDGVHLDAEATRAVGRALRAPVATLLSARETR